MKNYDKNLTLFFVIIFCLLFIPVILLFVGHLGFVGSTKLPWEFLIIGVIKLSIIGFFGFKIMKLYIKQEKHYFMDAKHLFAWQFIFIFIGKFYDLWLVVLSEGNIQSLESSIDFIMFLKIRWIIIVLTIAPTFFFFIHIYSMVWSQNLKVKQLDILPKRIEQLIDIIYFATTLILLIFSQSYNFLKILTPIIVFPIIIMGMVTFHGLKRNKRLPQLNSQFMIYSYLIYFSSEILRIFITSFNAILFLETISTIGFLISGCAFFIPPKYKIINQKFEIS